MKNSRKKLWKNSSEKVEMDDDLYVDFEEMEDNENENHSKNICRFEEILSEEIFQITNIKPEVGKRAVYLNGDLEIIYSLNLWSRLALDVLVELHHYKASNENELYNGAYDFYLENEFSIHETFSISSVVNSPFFNHSKYASLKIRHMVDQFKRLAKTKLSIRKPRS